MAMLDVGIKIEPGSGIAAAQKFWRSHDTIQKRQVSRSEVIYASHSTGSKEGEFA
jgi:alanine-glyoxylate transaminase/serine-glyoxylate transaminase/serine-pyruvate transaminase